MELREVVLMLEQLAGRLDHATRKASCTETSSRRTSSHKDGTPVLADFGLARMAGSAAQADQLRNRDGDPEYMSPEQAADEAIGPASDLYSFAIVAYEMLTGRVPFGADTPAAGPTLARDQAHAGRLGAAGSFRALEESCAGGWPSALRPVPDRRCFRRRPQARGMANGKRDEAIGNVPVTRRLIQPTGPPVGSSSTNGAANRELIRGVFAGVECRVRTAEDGWSALKAISASPPDLILLDVQMPAWMATKSAGVIKANSNSS